MRTPALIALAALLPAEPSVADSFAELVEMAKTAGPPSISAEATIYYLDAAGVLLKVEDGTNDWWCIAPSLALLGPKVPMCGDAVALDWLLAWINHEEPTPGAMGFIYALAGGRDASLVDPFRPAPAGNRPWVTTGPHLMVVNVPDEVLAVYPVASSPDLSVPCVVWTETPFVHLRIPVE